MKSNVPDKATATVPGEKVAGTTPVAVIDIGAGSVRMAVAEIGPAGGIRILESVSREVDLGKDTFTRGHLRKSTIEDCVAVLRSYQRLLKEYGVSEENRIRVVATSAVREAANSLAFVDRIAIATGLQVEPLDEAEVNRITYLGIQPLLKAEPELAGARAMVIEVGGGSTELLVVQGDNVAFSRTYRLGAIRLREMLNTYRAPTVKTRQIMVSQIRITVEEVIQHVSRSVAIEMIALGGDVRFAASRLLDRWDPDGINRLSLAALESLTDDLLDLTPGRIVQEYHLTFPEAETLAPALLTYVEMARAFDLREVLVAPVNLRDGLLHQMATRGVWTEEFNNQIIRSAIDLARKYQVNEAHARHVGELCRRLFYALQGEHQLDPRYELLLYLAALLHEIGAFVNPASHHKHSMYVIMNSDLFGLSKMDVRLVALVARYARRASPKPTHEGYATLDRTRRIVVAKMAALLRVADALDCSRSQRVTELRCSREDGRLVIAIPNTEDLSLEQLALDQKGPMFEETYGMQVLLRRARS
ncbi:MAG: HD domain-containing protein [Phycisphaerae bacterium]|nr:HD domain-containing protein [Phycisphaerae bacterium]